MARLTLHARCSDVVAGVAALTVAARLCAIARAAVVRGVAPAVSRSASRSSSILQVESQSENNILHLTCDKRLTSGRTHRR